MTCSGFNGAGFFNADMIKKGLFVGLIAVALFLVFKGVKKIDLNSDYSVGQPIDSLNHVMVYYNGGVDNVVERNTEEGYNIGLKYQCVEFVKRYYYEYYKHKMPDSYGHAKSFFDKAVPDGEINKQRNLIQYSNPSSAKPKKGDLLVMSGSLLNRYGHVAIISNVLEDQVEIIQQNAGPFTATRELFELTQLPDGNWKMEHNRIIGFLRK